MITPLTLAERAFIQRKVADERAMFARWLREYETALTVAEAEIVHWRGLVAALLPYYQQGVNCSEHEHWLTPDEVQAARTLEAQARAALQEATG